MDKPLSLEAFLYVLLRDHLTSGAVESLLHTAAIAEEKGASFSNQHLRNYIDEIAARFNVTKPEKHHFLQAYVNREDCCLQCGYHMNSLIHLREVSVREEKVQIHIVPTHDVTTTLCGLNVPKAFPAKPEKNPDSECHACTTHFQRSSTLEVIKVEF